MSNNKSLYPEDWFKIGAKELKRAENLLKLDDIEGAGFNLKNSSQLCCGVNLLVPPPF